MEHGSHELGLIIGITMAISIAWVGGLIAHQLRQSPIIGYLLAGMAIGPFTPGFVASSHQITVFAEVGVIFLMFALGIEFSLKELARIKFPAIIGTSLQLLLIMAGGAILGTFLGWPIERSIFFGGIISISSTMVILKNLITRGETRSNHGNLLLGMLIVQDLAVVIMILMLPQLAKGSESALSDVLLLLFKAVVFIAVTLLLGARVIPKVMTRVAQLQSAELFLLTAVVLALGTASVSGWLGLSPALGAFMAGLMLTETEFDHRVIAELIPMRDLFATLFFVSVGMLINVNFMAANLPAVLGMAVFIVLLKTIATGLALLPFRLGSKTSAFTAMGMIPIGEFNFVLAQTGRAAGVIPVELYNLILASSLFTIVMTPAAFWGAPRTARFFDGLPILGPLLKPTEITEEKELELEGHAIIIGYGRVGKRMARGLRQAGLKVIVIEQDLNVVRELEERGLLAVYGDASYQNVLDAAHPATARVIIIALPDFGATRAVVHRARGANPDVTIIARAQRAENDVKLREAGATTVVVPEIAGALMLLEETLLLLGLPHEHIFTGIAPPMPPFDVTNVLEAEAPMIARDVPADATIIPNTN